MYAFFPGCVSRGGCPELYPATITVCERLGIRLNELKGCLLYTSDAADE